MPSIVTAAQCSNRIPDPKQYLIEAGASLADKATPEALRLIDPTVKLPYSDLFQTLAAADQMAQCIRERRYKETLNILTGSGGRLLGDHLLENAGFGWIGTAVAPIKYALYKFLNVAASDALEFNIRAYIQARQAGVSHGQIINKAADCMDDQGWLIPCERTRAGWSPTQHVPDYTPAEVYEFARSIYDAQNKFATLQRDKQVVFNSFQEQIGSTKRSSEATHWKVNLNGIGPIRVGMSPRQASQAIGAQLVGYGQSTGGECYYIHLEKETKGVDFMIIGGRVARIDVNTPEITTVSGARVGYTEDQIKSIYPGQLAVGPHKYVEKGHYLTFIPKDPQFSQYRLIFETDGKVVTSYRAGKLPEVEWVEHCG